MDEEERKAKLVNLYHMDQLFHELGKKVEKMVKSRESIIMARDKEIVDLREKLKVTNVRLTNVEDMLKDRDKEIVDLREEPKVTTCPF